MSPFSLLSVLVQERNSMPKSSRDDHSFTNQHFASVTVYSIVCIINTCICTNSCAGFVLVHVNAYMYVCIFTSLCYMYTRAIVYHLIVLSVRHALPVSVLPSSVRSKNAHHNTHIPFTDTFVQTYHTPSLYTWVEQ